VSRHESTLSSESAARRDARRVRREVRRLTETMQRRHRSAVARPEDPKINKVF
jgi:hypothetical protein